MSDYSFKLSPILMPVAAGVVLVAVAMLVMVNVLNYTATIPEKDMNDAIQQEFPKELSAGNLKDPELHLVNAKVAICVTFTPHEESEIVQSKQGVRICAQGKPFWNAEEAAVYVKDFELLSAKANWLAFQTSRPLQEFIKTYVFGELDDLKVYTARQLVSTQVDSVAVVDNTLKIKY